jgi:serine O-acetyltransferase
MQFMKPLLSTWNSCFERFFSLSNNRLAVGIYYLSHKLNKWGVPFLPFSLQRANAWIHGLEIHYRAEIGKGLRICHSQGIVIGDRVKIGRGCAIYSSVVIGVNHTGGMFMPVIGNHVIFYSGAKVLGNVRIEDHAVIGANAVVLTDVPSGATAVGVPAKIIFRKRMESKCATE